MALTPNLMNSWNESEVMCTILPLVLQVKLAVQLYCFLVRQCLIMSLLCPEFYVGRITSKISHNMLAFYPFVSRHVEDEELACRVSQIPIVVLQAS